MRRRLIRRYFADDYVDTTFKRSARQNRLGYESCSSNPMKNNGRRTESSIPGWVSMTFLFILKSLNSSITI
jgi:hypothetical protein